VDYGVGCCHALHGMQGDGVDAVGDVPFFGVLVVCGSGFWRSEKKGAREKGPRLLERVLGFGLLKEKKGNNS